jgi:hypothetical protein
MWTRYKISKTKFYSEYPKERQRFDRNRESMDLAQISQQALVNRVMIFGTAQVTDIVDYPKYYKLLKKDCSTEIHLRIECSGLLGCCESQVLLN